MYEKLSNTTEEALIATGLFAKTSNCTANFALPRRFWKSTITPTAAQKASQRPPNKSGRAFSTCYAKSAPAKTNARGSHFRCAAIRVYDSTGHVIETHEHKGDFKEP